ncbi:PREDICTED: cysteine-rich receptor-like protein kinase 2 [Ipomoea nil]|uniref:cysteine-rich receptor-like protein kinase 2 n=1 Tax=Ipomoea nil TaxID=35883 RepID=UPI000900BEA2|nr:PREDICTED: cysteine-rich receptor-like protein kinase 2 [Ipomoea nil]
MAGSGSLWWLAVVILMVSVSKPAFSNPQTTLLASGCSSENASNPSDFLRKLNASFADLGHQLSGSNKSFATTANPVYAMAQCRNYLSKPDCVACIDAAVLESPSCLIALGATFIYDGCFIRYESYYFYDQITDSINWPLCGERTARKQDVFNTTAKQLLNELLLATPRIKGYFATAKRVSAGGGGATAYAVAQCVETITNSDCKACLTIAYNHMLRNCLPVSADGRAAEVGCFLRYSDTQFFPDNQTTNLQPFLHGGSSGKKKAIIGGVVGGVGIILVLAAIFLWYRQSKNPKASRKGNILGATQFRGSENYKYKDLKAATKDFSEENKLGEGGFGDVYKGKLQNGNVVAVKKLTMISSRAMADFETEVRLITNIHHPNLIRLLGYSGNQEELLLVYEYMANASLDRCLYRQNRGRLNWKQRVDIIFGTARGLSYLHEVCIIHRDIKSSNILLDDDFHPKIAEFGLARLSPKNKSHLTTKFAGTLGYTTPEYAIHGHLLEKVDIYSFGVVILEIISGRRSSEMRVEPVTEYLLVLAWKLYENEEHLELVDTSLDSNEYKAEEVKRMLEIALVCTQSPSNLRPSMSEVMGMLSSIDGSIIQRPQNRPTIITNNFDKRVPAVTATPSNATISLSEFSGR